MIILCLMLLLSSSISEATQKLWPSEINMSQVLFAPYLLNTYADVEGLVDFGEDAEGLDYYMLLPPRNDWTQRRSCHVENRGSGYLQTLATRNEFDDYWASIGVPFLLRLETRFLGLQKEHLLNSTFLTVTLFELNSDELSLVPSTEFKISLRKACELDPHCKPSLVDPTLPVHLHFEGPMVTPPFLFRKGQEIRIRVAWSSQGICDEDAVKFEMGDQIRVLAFFPES